MASSAQDPGTLPWSFAPWRHDEPPASGDPEWDRHPIDRFVRSRQSEAGLLPNPRADARTLARRAAVALLGLPPTPEHYGALRADDSEAAFAAFVDALLASPHHGERQARHWLDLARYSDSNGLDENLAFGNAFRYRDWVVRAHNDDLPFDRFVRMQIAGDLLAADPAVSLDGHVATGFLALGPRMLAEQDKEKLVLDTIDEQVDLLGRTFLGLTLGCARCHDHKFDPVSAADYYALAGVFRSTKSFAELGHVSRWLDRPLMTDAELAARAAAQREAEAAAKDLAAAEEQAAKAQREELVADAGRYLLAGSDLLARSWFAEAEASPRTSLRVDRATWGSADCGVLHTHRQGEQFAEWDVVVPADGRYVLEVRYAAQESRPMRILVDGAVVVAQALAETSGGWLPAHQEWFAAGEFALSAGAHVLRLSANGPHVPHLDALLLAPADLGAAPEFAGLLPPVARRAAAVLAGRPQQPLVAFWNRFATLAEPAFAAAVAQEPAKGGLGALLLGGLPPTSPRELAARCQTLFAAATAAAGERGAALQAVHALQWERGGLFALRAAALRDYLPATVLAGLNERRASAEQARRAVPDARPPVMCVAEGEVKDLPIHLRGNHLTLAPEPTPRGYLAALTRLAPGVPMPADESGRRQLADWIVDPALPLAARVHVNRIWQRAFGEGLVRSPSNFGNRGDLPSHPELLDWLARDFVAHGWSQKHLWRRILTSRTWQQSSAHRDDAFAIDPENRLLWRQHRRRLDAESVRDAMLAVAGNLDPTLGGSLLTTKDRDYVTNDQSNDAARYDSFRRSLYLPVIRNAMYDLFTAFDYVDPSVHMECRTSTAVATQALLLLNGPFVLQQSRALAARADREVPPDDGARIDWLWRTAHGRAATAPERAAAARWLAAARASTVPETAWPGLCQAVFASSEFLYVD